ncbi:hypothetical protein BDF20DRAFT_876025 [Mycotypha africana]|uniref:uncharacterized protein n=1 Tax=Mycotypha africana TaxID=64632 RepID=UPI0023013327|nr:uncharacterized protein BDF20DRAFT_876025 [Mycotypha africana]KAI8977645.1 hypothetical protein BDF20DRAFT_876025 [Mycotypha africana]
MANNNVNDITTIHQTKHINNDTVLQYVQLVDQFDGKCDVITAEAWLKSVNKLRMFSNLDDTTVLITMCINFKGEAQKWWNQIEDTTKTWCAFEEKFKDKYIHNGIKRGRKSKK